MPLQDMKLRPGIDRENTPTAVEGTWIESDKVRFRAGSAITSAGGPDDSRRP